METAVPTKPNDRPGRAPLRRRLLIATAILGAVIVVGVGVGLIALMSTNSAKLDDFSEARENLVTAQEAATELLDEAGSLEPETLTELQGWIDDADDLLAEEAPARLSFGIEDRTAGLAGGMRSGDEPTAALEEAIKHRALYQTQRPEAEEELSDAEDMLETRSGEVLDEDVYDQLSDRTDELNELLNTEPDETSGESFATLTTQIESAADAASESRGEVSNSHDDWVKAEKEREEAERQAEEEAAQTDPENYDSPSERDWALVERDPDAHEGEKYLLYGYVTQADAATGDISIRVDTGPTQQHRWHDYDVNTYLIAGRDDVFSDVVQGDHVEMLVEVAGAFTYDTAIGGSATAVLAAAYDVEVIGQL